MLNKLSEALKSGVKRISNAVFIDKKLIDSIIKELQRALIEADVNIDLVFQISQKIRKVALDEKIKGIDKKEQLIKLIHDQLEEILGEGKQLEIGKHTKILLLGLYGAGKTTSLAKLGFYYSKRGKKTCLLGLDTQRPAAMDQLEQLAEKSNLPVFTDKKEKDPIKIYKKYKKELDKYQLILIDTAGRDSLNKELVKEIKNLNKEIRPDYNLLVMPADIGQAAKTQAEKFQSALDIDAVIITRMDGTAKAGGALTACYETKAPVCFIGTGEKLHEIEQFNPQQFISRMLGMGDLQGLLEKVRSATSKEQEKRIQSRLEQGKFSLIDLHSQLDSMNQLGSMDKLLSMVPGMGKVKDKLQEKDINQQEKKMNAWKSAMNSMTLEELEHPNILEKQTSRISRIAKGSGTTTSNIRQLLKQYKMMQELVKSQNQLAEGNIDQKTLQKLARKFGKNMRL
ncbi:MAG: signal recognition particle receptor subunit alpha [Candidatus Nanoarchaeia archaeon]